MSKTVVEICSQHLHQEPEPLSERGVKIPAELEAIVLACLEKNPDRRPQSAAELPALDSHAAQNTGEARTIAVDGAQR